MTSPGGLVVQYDETLNEIAGRGLEGLAVRPRSDGGSWVAVLWEGGYSDPGKSEHVDHFPMAPLLVVHDLPAGATGFEHRLEDFPANPLDVPVPEGEEPEAQRFRAPDLVWHRLPGGEWGFIVLLSSENRSPDRRYHHRWIQRFDQNGKRVGKPVDIETSLPPDMQDLNWEGLGWFEEGQRLVTVHDDPDDAGPTEALVIELPEGW
jgi:hypothetical protein